jgi:hypothetical protein
MLIVKGSEATPPLKMIGVSCFRMNGKISLQSNPNHKDMHDQSTFGVHNVVEEPLGIINLEQWELVLKKEKASSGMRRRSNVRTAAVILI